MSKQVLNPEEVEFKQKLIERVRKREFLYNMKSADYKNVELKNETWDVIAKEVELNAYYEAQDAKFVRDAWVNMRDYHGRLKRDRAKKSQSGAAALPDPAWPFFKTLRFLDTFPSIHATKTTLKLKKEVKPAQSAARGDPSSEIVKDPVEDLNELDTSDGENDKFSVTQTTPKPNLRRSRPEQDDVRSSIMELVKDIRNNGKDWDREGTTASRASGTRQSSSKAKIDIPSDDDFMDDSVMGDLRAAMQRPVDIPSDDDFMDDSVMEDWVYTL
ncbi:hypothetical protein AAVH_24994 [Aphelenchoides avenae]|nr:hypothetical protein AAVH_24994 [Aphelenchus avenae]